MWMLGLGIAATRRSGAAIPIAAVTSLEILPASGLQADDGADAADANGWVAKIVLPDTGLAVFDATKIVLTVTDPGYTSPAAAPNATVIRTIRGGAVLRRQYPNEATPLNSASAGVRTIYFSLDDWVFGGWTVTAVAEAGFYGAAQSGPIAGPVNSSTKAYYKALTSWASLQHEKRTGDFPVELVVTHLYGMNGRMAAGVRFSATDEDGNGTGDIDVTATALSQEQTQGPPLEVFRGTIPILNMAQAKRGIINAKVYPWLGDATAVLDLAADGVATTGDWSNANPRTTLRFFCDKTGGYAGAFAVVESGAGTGTVQGSLAAARTTPFPSLESAYAALPAWNSTNKLHNDAGGGEIYTRNMTGSPVSIAVAAGIFTASGKTWVNIRPDPENTASIGLSITGLRQMPAYTRFMVPVTQGSGSCAIDGGGSFLWRPIALEATTLTVSGSTIPIGYRQPAMCLRNLTVTGLASNSAVPFSPAGSGRQQIAQAVGVISDDTAADVLASNMFSLLGCRLRRHYFADHSRASNPAMDSFDGSQFVSCQFLDIRSATVSNIGQGNAISAGFHAVNVLVEGTMGAVGGAWRLGGDSATAPMDNVLVAYSTVPGADASVASVTRFNFGYTDVAGAAGARKAVAIRFCIHHQVNIKTDTFTGSPAGTVTNTGRTQNWPSRYGVRHKGNVRVRPDANGTGAGPTAPTGRANITRAAVRSTLARSPLSTTRPARAAAVAAPTRSLDPPTLPTTACRQGMRCAGMTWLARCA